MTTSEPPFSPGTPQPARRRRSQLDALVRAAAVRARALMGAADGPATGDDADAVDIAATLSWQLVEHLREGRPTRRETRAIGELVGELQEIALELHEHRMNDHARRIAEVEASLAHLESVPTTADLLDRVCRELVVRGGFGRVLLSRVVDGDWTPWVAHFSDEMPSWDDTWLGTRIPLGDMVLEAQLLTEHRPELVTDTSAPGIHQIVRDGLSSSYVVAPVRPVGTVVGFLHADHHPSARRVDRTDRDVLWAFAEGFGHIYERTSALEGIRRQRAGLRGVMADVDAAMQRLSEAELQLATQAGTRLRAATPAASTAALTQDKLEELTAREREVLDLIVAGAKNATIAQRLLITEGTVKSHVKHILRKLGVANRSQVVALYHGVAQENVGR